MEEDFAGGLVSSVHAARRAVLSRVSGSACSEDEEVESILSQLKELSQLEECNDLELMQRLKRALMQHVPAPAADSVAAVMGLNTRSGLDVVRKELLQEIQSCVSATVSEADVSEEAASRLLCSRHVSGSGKASKKQKASGYFSFNFDDDQPLFEPLEATLSLLRKDPLDAVALHKMMEIDVGDLVEHQQWGELTSLLLSSLQHSWAAHVLPHSALAVQLHVRLMHGLEGEQRIDIAHNLLRHLWHCWIDQDGSTASQTANQSSNLAIFIDVIQTSLSQLQYCNSKQTDLFIATLFLLLARGSLVHPTSPSPSPSPSPSSVLDFLSCENATSIKDVMGLRSISVAIHAITSSLLSVLHARLSAAQKALLLANDGSPTRTTAKCFLVDACLFFGLSRPLCKMDRLRELTFAGTVGADFQWDGRMTSTSEAALEVVADTNKLLSHLTLTCPTSLAGLLKIDACLASYSTARNHLELLSSCASTLARIQRSDPSLQATNKANSSLGGVHALALLLLEHVAEHDLGHCISIIEALLQTVTFIPTTAHLAPFLHSLLRISSGQHLFIWSNLWMSITEFALACEGGYAPIASVLYASWNRILQCATAETFGDRMIGLLLRLASHIVECLLVSASAVTADLATEELMLHFLSSLVCCDYMREAFAGTQTLLLHDIVGVLLRHVVAASKSDSASLVRGSSAIVAVGSLLTIAAEFGPSTLTKCVVMADVILELGYVFDCSNVWDCALSESSESQLPLWSLLCGMATNGHVEEAFEVIVQASATLHRHCQNLGVVSAADLAAAADGEIHAQLASEGMYPFLLRFLTVASCNKKFCLAIWNRRQQSEQLHPRTAEAGGGIDFTRQFWLTVESHLENVVSSPSGEDGTVEGGPR